MCRLFTDPQIRGWPTQARFWLEWDSRRRTLGLCVGDWRDFKSLDKLTSSHSAIIAVPRLNASGRRESGRGQRGRCVLEWSCPTQAKSGLEWATSFCGGVLFCQPPVLARAPFTSPRSSVTDNDSPTCNPTSLLFDNLRRFAGRGADVSLCGSRFCP